MVFGGHFEIQDGLHAKYSFQVYIDSIIELFDPKNLYLEPKNVTLCSQEPEISLETWFLVAILKFKMAAMQNILPRYTLIAKMTCLIPKIYTPNQKCIKNVQFLTLNESDFIIDRLLT